MQVDDEHFAQIAGLVYPMWAHDPNEFADELAILFGQYSVRETNVMTSLVAQWLVEPRLRQGDTPQQLVDLVAERHKTWIDTTKAPIAEVVKIAAGDPSPRETIPAQNTIWAQLLLISALLHDSVDPTQDLVDFQFRVERYPLPQQAEWRAQAAAGRPGGVDAGQ